MKRLLAILFAALCSTVHAQTTGITVMADTNRVVRTNFTISNSQVIGLSTLLNAKLATNGNASALTNITAANISGTVAIASNVSGIIAIANGGTGSQTASNARVALGLGTAATNPASAFQPASTNLDALALNNGGSLTNLNAQNFLPSYSNNALKVLAVASNGTSIEWTAISNTVTDGSSITNIPASNISGILGLANGGTGGSNAVSARVNLLPAYSNNATKVLAVSTNEADVEWITITNTGGGSTSGVTSVDVSGGSTGLIASGGPITNSGTITLGGTLSIAAGGTGQTNAALAIEALLPSYTNNGGKVLGLDTNLALVWTTNAGGGGGSGTVTSIDASGGSTGMNFTGGPITTNGTLTLGGTLAIGSGGTGASDASTARINLLPAYTNNAGKALVLNTNATDVAWQVVPSVPVTVAQGGSGATNSTNALINFGVLKDSGTVAILTADAGSQSVAIGRLSSAMSNNAVAIGNGAVVDGNYGVAIGNGAYSLLGTAIGAQTTATDGAAAGYSAATEKGGAVGYNSESVNGFAGGFSAVTLQSNAVQLGTGTNATDNTVQFLSAGSVTTNQWNAIANSTAFGHYAMQAPTNGTANQVLALNSNATAVVWAANGGGGTIDLSTTNATGTLPVAKGGTGATNASSGLINLGLIASNSSTVSAVAVGLNTTLSAGTGAIAIGQSARSSSATANNGSITIGMNATNSTGIVIGSSATNGSSGVTIGHNASAANGIAIGPNARSSGGGASAIQIGTGTNTNANSIQMLTAGVIDSTEWGYLANASTQGGYALTNTAGISGSKTFVAYDGTNYTTNTVTISNGIITGWTP